MPLAVVLSGANRTDRKQLADLLDATRHAPPPALEPVEVQLCLDRGHDDAECCRGAAARGAPARHPPRRWVVEVGHSWCNRFRRRLIRWEQRADAYLGFVQLSACLIIYRKLRHA